MRISPSKEFPVEARFPSKSRLSRCEVENINAGGSAVKVPETEGLFEAGEILDEVELLIPDNGKAAVSGQIRFTRGDRCGIKCLEINHRTFLLTPIMLFSCSWQIQKFIYRQGKNCYTSNRKIILLCLYIRAGILNTGQDRYDIEK